jgi:hypothetical protein
MFKLLVEVGYLLNGFLNYELMLVLLFTAFIFFCFIISISITADIIIYIMRPNDIVKFMPNLVNIKPSMGALTIADIHIIDSDRLIQLALYLAGAIS